MQDCHDVNVYTLKEVGVPLTAMGRAAAVDLDPPTGRGAVSPAASTTSHKATSRL